MKRSVLFLCTGNSARSQMAEALLRHKAGKHFDVYSAGTKPDSLDERAVKALANMGVRTEVLVAKHTSVFEGKAFDFVITLCNQANGECRSFPNALAQLAWDLPDPKSRQGEQPFATTLSELNNRISMFLQVEGKVLPQPKQDPLTELEHFDPTMFYKSLADDIRLKTIMLAHYHGELCVCELMAALEEPSQPKVSRHLAVLKKAQIITDRKHGQWVFYQINPLLPLWAKAVIAQTTEHNVTSIHQELQRLTMMQNRPDKVGFCN